MTTTEICFSAREIYAPSLFCQLYCCYLSAVAAKLLKHLEVKLHTTNKRDCHNQVDRFKSNIITVMELGKEISPRKLKYSIHSCSSVSQSFHPDNILEDKPFDQASR